MTSKRVLITGANSYIGTSFEKYITKWNQEHPKEDHLIIDTLDMQSPSWKEHDFSKYDSVFHVAGIAHADTGKVSEERKQLYYKVNRDLAEETAKKAKEAGVKQFIYMSSIIVYGESKPGEDFIIDENTEPKPANFYGDSKLQAEQRLNALPDEKFKIAILRPPMIYGPGCKGNYQLLSKIARYSPLFPKYENKRSMLFIYNLCEFVRLLIINQDSGIFFPQNSEYVCTYEMVKAIAKAHNRKILLTPIFNVLIKLFMKLGGKSGKLCIKAFGNMTYSKSLSRYSLNYISFESTDSFFVTEGEFYHEDNYN